MIRAARPTLEAAAAVDALRSGEARGFGAALAQLIGWTLELAAEMCGTTAGDDHMERPLLPGAVSGEYSLDMTRERGGNVMDGHGR